MRRKIRAGACEMGSGRVPSFIPEGSLSAGLLLRDLLPCPTSPVAFGAFECDKR